MHTSSGHLECKHVIHAVGPIWDLKKPGQAYLLHKAVYSSLVKANDLKCESVSLPAISSGTYGFPKPLCAEVFYLATKEFVSDMT